MKSKIYFINSVIAYIKKIVKQISDDKVTIYAGQAALFVIISSVPFISLLFALFSVILPGKSPSDGIIDLPLSTSAMVLLDNISKELGSAPGVSLLSISALTTLWSASRGIASIRRGIETVYNADKSGGYVRNRLFSIISTLLFIGLIAAVVALFLFDTVLVDLFGDWIGAPFMKLRTPLFLLALTVFFTSIYYSVSKRSSYVKHSLLCHIPGAIFSSLGWVVFSYFYSLYIENFPGAIYIYGSLAAICLIMIWIYFCMIILLLGAEVNKIFFAKKEPSNK